MKVLDRYNKCSQIEKKSLDILYEYLGFNEIVSLEQYLEFMYKNAKENISFDHILNHTLKHIVISFWNDNPEYKNSYVTAFWINPCDIEKYTKVGSSVEYDPKGLLRHYVKHNFRKLYDSKL